MSKAEAAAAAAAVAPEEPGDEAIQFLTSVQLTALVIQPNAWASSARRRAAAESAARPEDRAQGTPPR